MAGRKITVRDRARAIKAALVRTKGIRITKGQGDHIRANMARCTGCPHRAHRHNIWTGAPWMFRCNAVGCDCVLNREGD